MPTCVFSQASCVTVVYLKCVLKCIHDGAYFYRHSRLHQVVKECRHQPNSGVLPFAEQYISLAWQQPVNTFNDSTSSGSYFAPAGCEILRLGCRSLYIGISVFFLCVYLFAGLSQKSNVLTTLKLNILPMTPMAWFGPRLTIMQYVMPFRFWGWRHVFAWQRMHTSVRMTSMDYW